MEADQSRQAYTSMMKFTIDGRPYIKDIHDLFAALIVQIPLSTHRYLFRNYNNTFSCEEAITALGSLKFSHTVRTPDPSDPSRFTRTTTTTTFNMAKDMAKALCQQFQQCRLIQNAVDPTNMNISDRTIWQLTPKGLCVLQDFCIRTEVDMESMRKYFADIRPIQLVRLERHGDDDQILVGRQHISLIFMVMVSSLPLDDGNNNNNTNNQQLPVPPLTKSSSKKDGNVGSSGSSVSSSGSSGSSSSPSTLAPFTMSTQVVNGDSRVQLLGNYLLTLSSKNGKNPSANTISSNIKLSNKKMRTLFSTQMACDWLIDYSTVSSYEEGEILLSEFIKYGWLEYQDSKYEDQYVRISKNVILVVTSKGKQVIIDTHQQQQTVSSKSSHHNNSNNNNNNNNNINSNSNNNGIKSDKESVTQISNENDETTLHEILKQDPESVMITTTTTLSDSNSSDIVLPRRNNSTSSNNKNNIKSRPPSAAMDYSPPVAIISANKVEVKESNAVKLKQILDDAQLRSLFKDFLRQNFCEENLDFWIDYSTLKRKLRNQSPALPSQNQKDLLEDAYDLWATYLKPGASSELNVEHSLRQEMARVVNAMVTVVPTYAPGTQSNSKTALVMSSHSVSQALRMILKWLDQVNDHICRLMATDSVPKFVRTSKYRKIMEQREKEEDVDIVDLQKQKLDNLFLDSNNDNSISSTMSTSSPNTTNIVSS
ncbi:unnamed protein product [Cunninghamella blakesleeana]